MAEAFAGTLSYGSYVPPYGTKRGKARMELMKERIVAEWEEDQRKKKAEEEGKVYDPTQDNSPTKLQKKKEKSRRTVDGKKEGFWKWMLRKMEGNW